MKKIDLRNELLKNRPFLKKLYEAKTKSQIRSLVNRHGTEKAQLVLRLFYEFANGHIPLTPNAKSKLKRRQNKDALSFFKSASKVNSIQSKGIQKIRQKLSFVLSLIPILFESLFTIV